MKKILFSLILIWMAAYTAHAQNLDKLMSSLGEEEGAVHHIMDKETLDSQMKQADPSGKLDAIILPSFMKKVELIETVIFDDGSDEIKKKVSSELGKVKNKGGFETLISVKNEDDLIKIITKKEKKQIRKIYVSVLADSAIILVKMEGNMDQNDIKEMMDEYEKGNFIKLD